MSNNQNQAAQAATQGASIEAERAACIEIVKRLGWTINGTWVLTPSGEQLHMLDALAFIREARRTPAAAVDAGELPPLPELIYHDYDPEDVEDMLRTYGQECARAAIEADRAQLAAKGHGEPVAWLCEGPCGSRCVAMNDQSSNTTDKVTPLYAAPASAQPATVTAPAQKDTPESMAASNARFAIDGAIQFGRENRNPPPSTDHWLYEYWNIGQQLRELGKTGWDNVTPLATERCSHCDGTGDVHTPTGEWRAPCTCPAAATVTEPAAPTAGFQKFDLTDYSKPVIYSNSAVAAPAAQQAQASAKNGEKATPETKKENNNA